MLPIVESAASVAVIGAGSWGTTVAAIMCEHATTTLWGRNPELVDAIAQRHENPNYLAGVALPDALQATTHLDAACTGADVVVMAVPSHGYRAVLQLAATAPAGSDGLVMLPYLLPERAPLWDPDLPGAYLGLRRMRGAGGVEPV